MTNITTNRLYKILNMHFCGMTNREISKEIGCHHNTISYNLKKFGLKSSYCNQPIKMVGENMAECSKCGGIKCISQFQYGRKGQQYEYKFSYCNKCRKQQSYRSLNEDVDRFLSDRWNRLKIRCKKYNITFSADKQRFIDQYHSQKGKCFYTDVIMEWKVGYGFKPNGISTDKIIPNDGYTNSNIVFCAKRINTIKSDLTLIELKEWIPKWYKRIIDHLTK